MSEWMTCQECESQQLNHVVALGGAAIPLLRAILLNGPPLDHLNELRAGLRLRAIVPTEATPLDTGMARGARSNGWASRKRTR